LLFSGAQLATTENKLLSCDPAVLFSLISLVTKKAAPDSPDVCRLRDVLANIRNFSSQLGYCQINFMDSDPICRCRWNVATYKWKDHNEKIEIISFVVKFGS
jgi:hypothetical protein